MSRDKDAQQPSGRKAARRARERERAAGTASAASRAGEKLERKANAAKRSGKGRRGLRLAAAVVSGTLLVGATGAAAASSGMWKAKERTLEVPAAHMPAGDTVLACAPTVHLVGGSAGTDQAYAPGAKAASSTLRAISLGDNAQRVPGAELLSGDRTLATLSQRLPEADAAKPATAAQDGFSGVKGASKSGQPANDASWLRTQSLGGLRSPAALTRTVVQSDGDLSGVATQACGAPSNNTWITGASTTLGHTAVLVVSNPSKTTASISIDVHTGEGLAREGAISSFTLDPGGSRSINLGGTARDADAVAVQVRSTGAPVSASLSQHVLRGLRPGGIELLAGGASPARDQTIAGIQLQDPKASQAVGHSEDAGDELPQVQLADASGHGTTAKVTAYGTDGKQTVLAQDVAVPRAGTATVALDSLPAGVYSLRIEAQDSVVASARVLRGTDAAKPIDLAVIPATDELSTDQVLALPEKGDSTLRLAALDGEATVQIAPIAADGTVGEVRNVQIGAGRTESIAAKDFGGAIGLRLASTKGSAHASLLTQAGAAGLGATAPAQLPDAPSSAKVSLLP